MSWIWLRKTEPYQPWAAFPIHVHSSVRAFLSLAIISEVGNGKNTLFGLIIGCMVSGYHLLSLTSLDCLLKGEQSKEQFAMLWLKWVGFQKVQSLLWPLLNFLFMGPLRGGAADQGRRLPLMVFSHQWKILNRISMWGIVVGAVHFIPWKRICKFFMWLVTNNRCWTADRLAKRGLPHEICQLCDQEEETIDHLLVSCVFTQQSVISSCSKWVCKP